MAGYVSLQDVTKTYQMGEVTIKAADGISFDVEKGELEFSGRVDSMIYSEIKTAGQMTTGVLKRLFK